MKLRIPKFMLKMASKRVSKIVTKEIDIDTNIDIHELSLDTKGKCYSIYSSETITLNKRDLKKFIKSNKN